MFRLFWKTVIRNLWKNRTNAIINMVGLAMGLASCLFLYAFLKYEYTFDINQPKAEQIYRVNITKDYPNRTLRDGNTESMLVTAIRNEIPNLEGIIQVIGPTNALVTIDPNTDQSRIFEEKRNLFYADTAFLSHFEYDFIAGNPKTALDDINNIVLSSKLVRKYYPDFVGREMDLLGKSIELHEEFTVTITGVIDNPPANSTIPFEALISAEIYYKLNEWDRDNWGNIAAGMTFVVLQPNQSIASVETQLKQIVQKYRHEDDAKIISYSLLNLLDIHSDPSWGYAGNYTTQKPMVIGFSVIGIFILISACINFINLQTAQSVNRAKEVGIRKVMGSSRWQLISQFLAETLILTSVAFLFALWIAEIALSEWNKLLSIVQMNMVLDWSVIGVGLLLIALVTLLAGFYPAIRLSGYEPVKALQNKFAVDKGGHKGTLFLRRTLVIVQFVISQLLLICTIVVALQMNYFVNKDLGFNTEQVLHISNFKPNQNQINQLAQGLSEIPEIEAFSISSGPPQTGTRYNTTFIEVGQEDKGDMRTENKFVDHRYLDFWDVELIAGRNFRADEYDDTIQGFIVNEALVKQLEVDNPREAVGKMLKSYGTRAPIVGVVKDFHNNVLNDEIGPVIMFCWNINSDGVDVKVNRGNYAAVLPQLETLWRSVYPSRTFAYLPMDDYMLQGYIVEDIMFKSIRVFAIIAILIGCLGLYGLVSYMAIQKTKEIGIRKVLGASYQQVLFIFSRKFFLWIIIAFAIAAPVAFQAMQLWLSNYAYRIELGWYIFALSLLVSIVLTAATISYKAIKIVLRNPVHALRYE